MQKNNDESTSAEVFRRRLFLFFEKYDPPRLKTLLAIVAKADGKEKAFMSAMMKKYGPEPPYTPFPDNEREALRKRLCEFYTKHDPSKVSGIESIVSKYIGADVELFQQLEKKYNGSSDEKGSSEVVEQKKKLPSSVKTEEAQPVVESPKTNKPTGGPSKIAGKKIPPPTPAVTQSAPVAATAAEILKERLSRFYHQYDTSKLSTIDALVAKFGDDGDKLLRALVKKYGPEPAAPSHVVEPQSPKTASKIENTLKKESPSTPIVLPHAVESSNTNSEAIVEKTQSQAQPLTSPAPQEDVVARPDAQPQAISSEVPPTDCQKVSPEGAEKIEEVKIPPKVELGGEEEIVASLEPVPETTAPVCPISHFSPTIPAPTPPVIFVTLKFLIAAAFDYFEDATEALELSVRVFEMMNGREAHQQTVCSSDDDEKPIHLVVVEYLRSSLGDDFISYLRGFSASTVGSAALSDSAAFGSIGGPAGEGSVRMSTEMVEGLADRLEGVFRQFEPQLVPLAVPLAQFCLGRADDLVVAIHARYSQQFGELQRKDMLAAMFKKRIADFVSYHTPSHTHLVPLLAELFRYSKEELLRELRRVYGPEPTIMDPAPLRLRTPAKRAADMSRLKTREGLMERCLEHMRLYRYLRISGALVGAGASAALGVSPGQWSNKMYRLITTSLLDFFLSAHRAIDCLSYTLGPEEVGRGESEDENTADVLTDELITSVSECLSRHQIDTNPVFLIINNSLTAPPPEHTGMSAADVVGYFIELCDDVFDQKPISEASRDVVRRYLKRESDLLGRLIGEDAVAQDAVEVDATLDAAVDVLYKANGHNESACIAYLEATYGPLPVDALEESISDGVDSEGCGAEEGSAIFKRNGTRQAKIQLLLSEEESTRRLIEFDEYADSSTAAARLRTALAEARTAAQLAEDLRCWMASRGEVFKNPLS